MKRAPQLFPIPPATPPAKCKSCGQMIFWIKTSLGANMPAAVMNWINGDLFTGAFEPSQPDDPKPFEGRGYSHHIDCPHADQHRKRKVQP